MLSDKKINTSPQDAHQFADISLKVPSFVMFVVYSIIVGGFFSRIHDLKSTLMLDEKDMGILLVSLPFGVLTGSVFISRIIDRYSAKKVILIGMPIFSVFPLLAIKSGSMSLAFIVLFFYGLFSSIMNIAINVEAHRIEGKYSIAVLNKCHGYFSIGFLLFSFAAAYLIGLGVTAENQHWLVFLVVSGTIMLLTVHHLGFKEKNLTSDHNTGAVQKTTLALPTLPILCVLLYGLFGFTVEGISRSWGVIYLEDLYDIDTATAAFALPFLIFGISLGRFLADRMISIMGTVKLSKQLIGVTLVGIAFLLFGSHHYLALLGIALIGFGISTVHPQSIKAVASLKGHTAAYNIAAFSTIQTMLMYVGPALFGLIAHYTGFRISLLIFVSLAICAYSSTRYLKN